MAITSYSELQDAVRNWGHRGTTDDLLIPDFIQQGENMLNRRLRTLDMYQTADMTASTSVNTLALPAGFLEPLALFLKAPGETDSEEIWFIEPESFTETTNIRRPQFYTISTTLVFDSVSDQAYQVEFKYRKKYDIAADTTNWLIQEYPEAYLYSALYYLAMYTRDATQAQANKAEAESLIAMINRHETKRIGNDTRVMRTELPFSRTQNFRNQGRY